MNFTIFRFFFFHLAGKLNFFFVFAPGFSKKWKRDYQSFFFIECFYHFFIFHFYFLFIHLFNVTRMPRTNKNTLSQIRGSISRLTFPSVFLPWLFAGPWIPISYIRWVLHVCTSKKFVFGNLEYFSFQFISNSFGVVCFNAKFSFSMSFRSYHQQLSLVRRNVVTCDVASI